MKILSITELDKILATKNSEYICSSIKSLEYIEYATLATFHKYLITCDRSQVLEVSEALFNNAEILSSKIFKKYVSQSKLLIYKRLLENEWIKEAEQFEVYIDKVNDLSKICEVYLESYQNGSLKTVKYIEKTYPSFENERPEAVLYKIVYNGKNPVEMFKHFESIKNITNDSVFNTIEASVTFKNAVLLNYLLEIPDNGMTLKKKEDYLSNNIDERKNELEIMDVLTRNLLSDNTYRLPSHIYAFIKSADQKLTEYIDKVYLYNDLDKNLPNLNHKKSKKI